MVNERKRAQFSELSEDKKKIVSKRCFDVTLECNFGGSKIKEKYNFASSQFILDKAKYYADNYATPTEKLTYLNAKKKYEDLAKSNGIYYTKNTIYQQYIDDIIKIESMDELEKYIKGENPYSKEIPLHSLNLAIDDRSRALGDEDGIYKSAKNKLLEYVKYKYEKREKANKEKSALTLEENKVLSVTTLQNFLDSEFITKKDYCKENKLSENIFDKRVANVKEFNPEFYYEYQNKLKKKEQVYYASLKPVVEDIISNVNANKDYNIIDYYLAYSDLYKFSDLCKTCLIYDNDIRVLKSFFSKVDVRSTLTLDSFIEHSYTVSGHTYTDKEKEEIYNYAKEHKIPLNWQNISLLTAKQNKTQRAA